jgi:4-amino-4-deoxy-L-arabinose transferase-like glycosyltransferase
MAEVPDPQARHDRIILWTSLLVAAVLRFYDLSLLPPAHYRDVALTAIDGLRAASGHPCLHFTYDEGLYANLMGLVFLILGPSDWTVRAQGALFGVLTCLGVWRLGRALGLGRAAAYGSALLALSLWHVILSRSGFRAVLLPLLLAFSFALLVEGLRGQGTGRMIAAGVLLGLGVHVYPSIRFAPLILPPLLLAELGFERKAWERARRGLVVYCASAFVVALPMLLNYLHHPEHFTLPRRLLSVFSPKYDRTYLIPDLLRNLESTLLMFHLSGDLNWRHNISGAPMLDPVTGLLFLLGLWVVWRGGQESGRRPGSTRALLLAWMLAMLLPNVLSIEGVPHALRSCGVLPAVALIGGVGLAEAERRLGRAVGPKKALVPVCALLLGLAGLTAYRYFIVWGEDPRVLEAHDGAYKAAARVLLEAPGDVTPFLIADGAGLRSHGQPAEVQPYLFEMRGRPPVVIGPRDADRMILQGKPALVAFILRDDRILEVIRGLNPGAPVAEVQAPGLSPSSPVYRIN